MARPSTVAGYATPPRPTHDRRALRLKLVTDAIADGVHTRTCPFCGASDATTTQTLQQRWAPLAMLILAATFLLMTAQGWLASQRVAVLVHQAEYGTPPDGLIAQLVTSGDWERWVLPYSTLGLTALAIVLVVLVHAFVPPRRRLVASSCGPCVREARRVDRARMVIGGIEAGVVFLLFGVPSAMRLTPALWGPVLFVALLVSIGGRWLYRVDLLQPFIRRRNARSTAVVVPASWQTVLRAEAPELLGRD